MTSALPSVGLITSNDVLDGKPYPAPYLAGANKYNVKSSSCLVVEDAISDLKAGQSAGAQTVRISATWIDGQVEIQISDITEIKY